MIPTLIRDLHPEASAAYNALQTLADACTIAGDEHTASVVRGISVALLGRNPASTDEIESIAQRVTMALLDNA